MMNPCPVGVPCRALALLFVVVASSWAQECPTDEEFPYAFRYVDEAGVTHFTSRCTSDPHHVYENGVRLKPFRRPFPGCVIVERPRAADVWMPKIALASEPDSVRVYAFENQFADIFDGFKQWNSLCPQSGGPPDCCMKVRFVDDPREWEPISLDPETPMVLESYWNNPGCTPSCDLTHLYINDTPIWFYEKAQPNPSDSIVRSFHTGGVTLRSRHSTPSTASTNCWNMRRETGTGWWTARGAAARTRSA